MSFGVVSRVTPMAKLYLFRDEMEVYAPPPVCMRCAETSSVCVSKAFYWSRGGYFSWGLMGHLIHGILLLLGTRRFRVVIPLCDRCFRGRRAYRRFVLVGLVGLLLAASAGVVLLAAGKGGDNALAPALLGAAGLWAVILLFVCAVHQARSMSPAEITRPWIALARVAPAFVEAVDILRRDYPPGLRQRISETVWGHRGAYEPGFEIARDRSPSPGA
jgi:hypothetical protein